MKRAALSLAVSLLALAGGGQGAYARTAVNASAVQDVAVTVYRDPNRGPSDTLNAGWPQGFAMISETRTVTLPPGESTIRFDGVAEGMVAVSAIVTGLPGGTIEKNRNADLLSPAALVDGTLGNRVTLTRTNPVTGIAQSENAVIRTRADGGLVLQTPAGFEAVRCSGLPEGLTFDRVPTGLSAQPVFSIDTRDASGGTYQVVLTYLAWGFDWQAHYVATFGERGRDGKENLSLRSWLTLLNDNGQSFDNAELLVVAGALNIVSDFQQLSDPPQARPLQLTCYPIGSTADGSPIPYYGGGAYPLPAPPPVAMAAAPAAEIIVTGARRMESLADSSVMTATEEQLGDLKLYRVPERVTVASKGLKQVAFLDRQDVKGEFQYRHACSPWSDEEDAQGMRMILRTKNDKKHGLGVALPMGSMTVFEPSQRGELLVGEDFLRDYAEGQDVDIQLGQSSNVYAQCVNVAEDDQGHWTSMKITLSNANNKPVPVRVELGNPAEWNVRQKLSGLAIKDGQRVIERFIPAGKTVTISWDMAEVGAEHE